MNFCTFLAIGCFIMMLVAIIAWASVPRDSKDSWGIAVVTCFVLGWLLLANGQFPLSIDIPPAPVKEVAKR